MTIPHLQAKTDTILVPTIERSGGALTPRSTATEGLVPMQPQYTCLHCGRSFTQRRGSKVNKYCSRHCAGQGNVQSVVSRLLGGFDVDLDTGCWEWRGKPSGQGYGRLSVNGKPELVHRVSYEHFHGPTPDGVEVCHRCDNRICMNPDHLFLGTHHENVLDAQSKGRLVGASMPGESNPISRLTEDHVREIRRRYAAGGVTQRSLADEFGVDVTTVNLVVLRKTWRHVEPETAS